MVVGSLSLKKQGALQLNNTMARHEESPFRNKVLLHIDIYDKTLSISNIPGWPKHKRGHRTFKT